MDAGMDSISSVEFRNRIDESLPVASLPATLVFDYPTIRAIVDFINDAVKHATADTAREQARDETTQSSMKKMEYNFDLLESLPANHGNQNVFVRQGNTCHL
jgi:hypothetical protein